MIYTRSFLYVESGVQPGVKRGFTPLNICILSQKVLPVTTEGGIFDPFLTLFDPPKPSKTRGGVRGRGGICTSTTKPRFHGLWIGFFFPLNGPQNGCILRYTPPFLTLFGHFFTFLTLFGVRGPKSSSLMNYSEMSTCSSGTGICLISTIKQWRCQTQRQQLKMN